MACADPLPRLFNALLVACVAGCPADEEPPGSGEPPETIDLERFNTNVCEGFDWSMLELVEPVAPVDYLEFRSFFDDGIVDAEFDVTVIDSDGELCAGATDVAACREAFEGLPFDSDLIGLTLFETFHYTLAFTRGDEVGVLRTRRDVLDFLGELDTPGDAAVWGEMTNLGLLCGEGPDVGEHPDGFVLHTTLGDTCGGDRLERVLLVMPDGSYRVLQEVVAERGDPNCATGRLPDGLCGRGASRATNPVGRFMAGVAELEAASVPAFEQFGAELRAHGAPELFVRGAATARADEVRHARTTRAMAELLGARVRFPRVRRVPVKDMVSMAVDNVAEGCVRETFGALVALAQARRARDPRVRRAMATIARDEARHAQLSWRVARWAKSRMHSTERAHLARSARRSIAQLREELTVAFHPRVHAELGIPEPEVSRALFAGLYAAMFRGLEQA